MTQRWKTHYTVQAIHPDKKEPFDIYINYFTTLSLAKEAAAVLLDQGYDHITISPPEPAE